jgi:hypothetical protein
MSKDDNASKAISGLAIVSFLGLIGWQANRINQLGEKVVYLEAAKEWNKERIGANSDNIEKLREEIRELREASVKVR